jgi:Spy/CpxP family protein refolding chaperone
MTDAEIEDRVTRMVRHLSIEIDATPEQEARLIEVATGAAGELRPVKERMKATRSELQQLLTADRIDREALEALRAARLADADRISKTLVAAVADLAEVLTPEQRETVQRMIRERRGRHHGRGG